MSLCSLKFQKHGSFKSDFFPYRTQPTLPAELIQGQTDSPSLKVISTTYPCFSAIVNYAQDTLKLYHMLPK